MSVWGRSWVTELGERKYRRLSEWKYASSIHKEYSKQASIILQAGMFKECFNLSQLLSPEKGLF